jgi:hypothetical protein
MSEFDPLGSLVEAARPEMDANEADCARLHARMVRRVGLAALSAAIPTAAAGGAIAAPVAATSGVVKLLAVLSFMGAAGGGIAYMTHATKTASPANSPSVVSTTTAPRESPSPANAAQPALPPSSPETSASAAKPETIARPILGARAAAASPSRPSPSENTLSDEYALIARAQAALKAHDPSLSLSLLNEHASRFPKGQLAEEREALRVLTGCSLGRADARSSAERFLRTHPSSPFSLRIRTACDSK